MSGTWAMTSPVAGFSTAMSAWASLAATGVSSRVDMPSTLVKTALRLAGEAERLDRDRLDRAVAAVGLRRADLVDDVLAVLHLAEDCVLAVEPRRLGGRDDEELRAVGVRPGVRHRERAADDLVLVELVLERVAGAAGAGALGAAALDHEVV